MIKPGFPLTPVRKVPPILDQAELYICLGMSSLPTQSGDPSVFYFLPV